MRGPHHETPFQLIREQGPIPHGLSKLSQCLANALTVNVGTGTNMSRFPTYRDLSAEEPSGNSEIHTAKPLLIKNTSGRCFAEEAKRLSLG